jgi:hypothetical protein
MNRPTRLLLALAFLLCALPVLAQQRFIEGTLDRGLGKFRIDYPINWRPGGPLIIYNHGFTFTPPEQSGFPQTAPDVAVRIALLRDGYALAAGSYADRGWALFDIEAAQRALLAEVRERLGDPGEIILFGGSLGGLVSLKTAEALLADGEPVKGVLSACAPLGGARTFQHALDVRLAFDAVCPESPLPRGSNPALPWVLDLADIPPSITNFDDPDSLLTVASVANRIRQCTGLFQPALLDTDAQRQRRAQLRSLLGIDSDEFLKTQLAYAVFALSEIVQSPRKMDGFNPFDNRFVEYGAALDGRIARVARDPLAAVKFGAVSDLTGRWGDVRVLALHTDLDQLVYPEHLGVLEELTPRGAREPVSLIIREQRPSHCGFTAPELNTALGALRQWIDRDVVPDPAVLRTRCRAEVPDDRCGFDPGFSPSPLEGKIRPRKLAIDTTNRHHVGAWYDPAFDGEGWVVEVLPNGIDAVVTWYTYPDAGQPGEQRWIAGVGRINADGIHVADAFETRGPAFGAFDPARVEYRPWGEFTLAFERCGSGPVSNGGLGVGRLRYRGNNGSEGERALRQIGHNAVFPEHCLSFSPPQQAHPNSRFSGSWFRGGDQAGEGIQLQVDARGNAVLVWYTYDPQGNPAWLLGTASAAERSSSFRFQMVRPRGTRFGADFNRNAVQAPVWGSIELSFSDCSNARLRYTPSEAGWAAGEIALVPLSRPAGTALCAF